MYTYEEQLRKKSAGITANYSLLESPGILILWQSVVTIRVVDNIVQKHINILARE